LTNGRNGSAAYRAAYNTTAAPLGVAQAASHLLTHYKIKPIIEAADAHLAAATAKTMERYVVNETRIKEELARIGFSNMADFVRFADDGSPYLHLTDATRDEMAALSSVTIEEYKDGRGPTARDVKSLKIVLHDKKGALVDLGKHIGMFVNKSSVQVSGPDGGPIEVVDARERIASRIAGLLTRSGPAEGTGGPDDSGSGGT
jgi:phage terminase small subunit